MLAYRAQLLEGGKWATKGTKFKEAQFSEHCKYRIVTCKKWRINASLNFAPNTPFALH